MQLPTLKDNNWPNPLAQGETVLEGWAVELAYPNITGFQHHFQLYNDMVDFIKENVVKYENNALWTKIGDCIYIKLRKKQDATLFILRFGA